MVKYVMRDVILDCAIAITCECGNTMAYYTVIDTYAICHECNKKYKVTVEYTTETTITEVKAANAASQDNRAS
jgi:hypothetical protein